MAKTFTLTSGSYQGRYMQVYCTQTIDIATNTSKIDWTLSSIGGSSNYYSTGATTLKINGETVYSKARVNWDAKTFPAAKGSVSGTISFIHDEKGDKSITVSLTTAIYVGEASASTYSDRWYLDNIPRQAKITYAPDFNDLENPTISFSNPAGNAVDSLAACISFTGANDDIPYKEIKDKTSTSFTFELSESERDTLRNNTTSGTRDVMFFVRTEIGGNRFFSIETRKLTIAKTDEKLPSVTMTVALNNSSLPSEVKDEIKKTYIQGKSRLDINLTAQGKYGASIDSYIASVDGKRYYSSSFTTDVIMNSGSVFVYGYAMDSRGFLGEKSQEISVFEYSKPLIVPINNYTPIQCYRSDGNGNKIGNSTSVWIKAKRSYYDLSGNNTCALEWRRKSITEAWDNNKHKWHKLIAKTDTSTDVYDALITDESDDDVFEVTSSYVVQIRAIDDIGEYDTEEFDIPTQEVTLHLGKGGKNVSVGTYCDYSEPYTFYSDWKAIFDKGVYIGEDKLPISDFIIERGTDGIWTYEKWASGKAVCWGVSTQENVPIDIAWGSLFESPPYVFELPKDLFIDTPQFDIALVSTSGVLLEVFSKGSKTETPHLCAIRPFALTAEILNISIVARGRWK